MGEPGARAGRVSARTISALLERGDATDVGDILAAGDESAVVDRLRGFRDAGATDLAVRVLPFGPHREARIESRERTLAFLASLCPEL